MALLVRPNQASRRRDEEALRQCRAREAELLQALESEVQLAERRMEQVQARLALQDDRLGALESDLKDLDRVLGELEKVVMRLGEWTRLSERAHEHELQRRREGADGGERRLQAMERQLGLLTQTKARIVAYGTGVAAGYVAWRGVDMRLVIDKLVSLLR